MSVRGKDMSSNTGVNNLLEFLNFFWFCTGVIEENNSTMLQGKGIIYIKF